jgi:hypothetical protein
MEMEKRLVGGQKMREMGSTRHTDDLDYLVYDESDSRLFINSESQDFINCANHKFYEAIWNLGEITAQAMLEMAAFTFVQHCMNGNFVKADSKEFDIKHLARLIGKDAKIEIANEFITAGQEQEVKNIITSVKF